MIKKEDIRKGDAIRIRIAFLREPDAIRMIDEGIVDGKCVLYVDYFDANYVVCYQRGFAYNKDYNVNDIAIPTDVFCKEAMMLLSNKAAKELNESLEKEEQSRKEQVSHPSHYAWLKDLCGVEPLDICRHLDFNVGNAIKYLLRKDKVDGDKTKTEKRIEDLRKAVFYIEDEIKLLKDGKE